MSAVTRDTGGTLALRGTRGYIGSSWHPWVQWLFAAPVGTLALCGSMCTLALCGTEVHWLLVTPWGTLALCGTGGILDLCGPNQI